MRADLDGGEELHCGAGGLQGRRGRPGLHPRPVRAAGAEGAHPQQEEHLPPLPEHGGRECGGVY